MSNRVPPFRRRSHVGANDRVLAGKLARLERDVERQRLSIFRAHAARQVCLASPLLISGCRQSDIDDAAWRLSPTARWPHVNSLQSAIGNWSARQRRFGPAKSEFGGAQGAAPETADVAVLRLTSRAAHLILRVGETSLRTSDDGGWLALPGLLSLSRRDELIGGPLDRAFAHPSASGGDYVVQSATLDPARLRTILCFAAAPAEWRMPWARPWVSVGF